MPLLLPGTKQVPSHPVLHIRFVRCKGALRNLTLKCFIMTGKRVENVVLCLFPSGHSSARRARNRGPVTNEE